LPRSRVLATWSWLAAMLCGEEAHRGRSYRLHPADVHPLNQVRSSRVNPLPLRAKGVVESRVNPLPLRAQQGVMESRERRAGARIRTADTAKCGNGDLDLFVGLRRCEMKRSQLTVRL